MRLFKKRKPKPKEATISAVVIRKDGTREDLGVVARGHILEMKPEAGGK
jgi:hypothetical protein